MGDKQLWLRQEDYKLIGELLCTVREQAGFSQQELASRLKKPQSFVSSYERGQRRLDLLEFIKIATTIGADPDKLFSRVSAKLQQSKRSVLRR